MWQSSQNSVKSDLTDAYFIWGAVTVCTLHLSPSACVHTSVRARVCVPCASVDFRTSRKLSLRCGSLCGSWERERTSEKERERAGRWERERERERGAGGGARASRGERRPGRARGGRGREREREREWVRERERERECERERERDREWTRGERERRPSGSVCLRDGRHGKYKHYILARERTPAAVKLATVIS